jgi:ATP-binding cassette, subfamily C, bacterial CydD
MNLDRRLLRLVCSVRVAFGLAVVCGLGAGVLLVLQAYALSQTVSRVFLDGHTLRDVRGLLVALVMLSVLRAGFVWGSEAAAHHVAAHIKHSLRARLFRHLLALGPAYTRRERSGELATTATTGIEELDAYFSQYLPQLFLSALVPLAMLALIAPIDPLSGLVLLLTAPLIPFFMVLIGSVAQSHARRQWTALSRMSAHFLDVLQGLTTLKIFGRSREQAATIARISAEFRDTTMSVLRIAFLSALALELLSTLSTALVAVQIGLRLLHDYISFEEAFFVLILTPEFYLPLRQLGTRFHAGMSGATAARRIFAVLETPAARGEGKNPRKIGSPTVRFTGRGFRGGVNRAPTTIRFEDVHYTYPGAADNGDDDRPALHGVSFTLAPGQHVALVGPSGSGKTTITHLLLRFIAPSGGTITVDGHDLRAIPPDAWRTQIAWVPQMPYLFHASVADNIRLGRPDAPHADVVRAAEQAHAAVFIDTLPDSYATVIGERGARLSGGQAQRIALARAFLKDAPLLILDEPTSNLDPDTEARLQDALRTLMQGRTALVIAHRVHTVTAAGQIIVLDRGQIAASGTHDALQRANELYAALLAGGTD